MPLRAMVDDVEWIAPLKSAAEWAELKSRARAGTASVRIPCCGARGHLRVSKNGVRHFVHRRAGACSSAPETASHLLAKQELLMGCVDAGWEANTEVAGANWRADVMASRGKGRIAFEVQWSRQTEADTRDRQARYAADDVRGCWFFRHPPEALLRRPEKMIPAFRLVPSVGSDPMRVAHLDRLFPLREFASLLLSRRIQFRERISLARQQRVTVVFYGTSCWKCGFHGHDYHVSDGFVTPCGIAGGYVDESTEGNSLQFEPQVVAAVRRFLSAGGKGLVHLGEIKPRYSRTREQSYTSVGCARCDALFGEFHKPSAIAEAEYSRAGSALTLDVPVDCRSRRTAEHPHWCLPTSGTFCGDP